MKMTFKAPLHFRCIYLLGFILSCLALPSQFAYSGYSSSDEEDTSESQPFVDRRPELTETIQQALIHLRNISDPGNKMVIIDIDDTALETDPEHPRYRRPIPQIYVLYQILIQMKFKVFFLTASSSLIHSRLTEELAFHEYFGYQRIITMPHPLHQTISQLPHFSEQAQHISKWKREERLKLALQYDREIVATIDDLPGNLEGPHTGYPILVQRLAVQYPSFAETF